MKNCEKKILIIIPAYNEGSNIGKVLDEIKSDLSFVDVIVIDDHSSDNTQEIVKSKKVKCIRNIINLGYAGAVQTGIKYAFENNYDYAIQFDADGQHIASEAKKIIDYACSRNDTDIIIGSRYVKDLGYKCPLFRKIGTVFFSRIIKIFCRENIADPLSGFQCINKKVIKKFSQAGEYPQYPDANLIVDMIKQGYKYAEIPVKMRNREDGESMHSGIIKPAKYMVHVFYSIFIILIQNLGKKKERTNE